MEKNFSSLAPKYFQEGFSCSEAITRAAVEIGLADESFVSISTSFSGGMSSKCLCGAVAGCEMVIGLLYGKYKTNTARALAKEFYEKFTDKYKVTCCKVLSGAFKDHSSPERRANCLNIVAYASSVLDEMLIEHKDELLVK